MSEKIVASIAIILAAVATWFAVRPDSGAYSPKPEMIQVAVARADIGPGTVLTESMLEPRPMPRLYTQAGAFELRNPSDLKNPAGRVTAVRIPKGDQVTENCLKGGEKAPATAKTTDKKELAQQRYTEGLRQFQANNYEKAREEWNESLKLDPGNPDSAAGLDRIKKITSK